MSKGTWRWRWRRRWRWRSPRRRCAMWRRWHGTWATKTFDLLCSAAANVAIYKRFAFCFSFWLLPLRLLLFPSSISKQTQTCISMCVCVLLGNPQRHSYLYLFEAATKLVFQWLARCQVILISRLLLGTTTYKPARSPNWIAKRVNSSKAL